MTEIELVFSDGIKICRYETDANNNFICKNKDKSKVILLENVSEIFDGIFDANGESHFIIQTLDGGLTYLKNIEDAWIKFELFRSRSGHRSIKKIRLTYSPGGLCAFYILEHYGKYMLVKHIFSEFNTDCEPVIIDFTDVRADFSVCTDGDDTIVFYRNKSGLRKEKRFNTFFSEINHEYQKTKSDIFTLSATHCKTAVFTVYVELMKSYPTLITEKYPSGENRKTLAFAVHKNCNPKIYSYGNIIVVEWIEESRIMRSSSSDNGRTFSTPENVASASQRISLRLRGARCGQFVDECVITGDENDILNFSGGYFMNSENKKDSHTIFNSDTTEDYDFDTGAIFMKKLADIENDIDEIGIRLEKMCEFLKKLSSFKNNPELTDFSVYTENNRQSSEPITATLSGADIGEKNDENIKLFENMSIEE